MERAYYGLLRPAVSKKLCQFQFWVDRPVLALYNLSRILLEKRIRTELLRLDICASGEGEIYLACDIEKEFVNDATQLFYRADGVIDMQCLGDEGKGNKDQCRKGPNQKTHH
jgi:hypothetical protein